MNSKDDNHKQIDTEKKSEDSHFFGFGKKHVNFSNGNFKKTKKKEEQ